MPQGWTVVNEPPGWTVVKDGPSQLTESVAHAQMRGLKEGATQGASDLYEGTKEGLGSVAQMVRHPLDTLSALGGGLKAGAEAVPDVARNLANADAREATVKGFLHGGAEGATGTNTDDGSFSKNVGRFIGGTVIPAVATAGLVKGVKILRAPAAPSLVVETNAGQQILKVKPKGSIGVVEPSTSPSATTSRVPYAAPVEAPEVKAAKAPTNAGGKLVAGGGQASTPPVRDVAQAVSDALTEIAQKPEDPAFQTQAARRAPRIAKVAEQNVAAEPAAAPATELPAAWKALVESTAPTPTAKAAPAKVMAPATPRPMLTDAPVWSTGLTPEDARAAFGSREAAKLLGTTPEDVRASAPGPSRQPMKKLLAELDAEYTRRLNDERGAVDPALLRTLGMAVGGGLVGSLAADDHPLAGGAIGALGGAALANPVTALKGLQQARMIGMLSGAAFPKSLAGNVGAVLTAAAENGSTAPIREAMRVPTNVKNFASGFVNGSHPDAGVVGKFNVFGRAMSGADAMTSQALERAGVDESARQRLLLNKPKPLGNGALAQAAASPIGETILPFQTIPMNTVAEGINAVNELAPKSGASNVRRALTVGAGVAGAGAGRETENPLILGMLAALAGPRAIPFALGAGLTAGPKVIERVGVGLPDASVKDVTDPLRPINKPALLRLLEQLGGG